MENGFYDVGGNLPVILQRNITCGLCGGIFPVEQYPVEKYRWFIYHTLITCGNIPCPASEKKFEVFPIWLNPYME
jgi:hypothetical protein